MNDNVHKLHPDSPAMVKANRSSVEEMAQRLEQLAAELRSGEETMQFGMMVWYNHKNQCIRWQVGQQTTHENIMLLTLAQSYACQDVYNG